MEPVSGQEITCQEILCSCCNVTVGDLQATLQNRDLALDDLMRETGAGTKCTACLLDLEYHLATLPRGAAGSGPFDARGSRTRTGLKQSLYQIADRLAPKVAVQLLEHAPVLAGAGLETWIGMANDSFLYEGRRSAPPILLRVTVRDCDGRLLKRYEERVETDKALRLPVSRDLPGEGLRIGQAEVERIALESGYRGTTRPQIEILASRGSCAVHCHGPGERLKKQRFFTCLHRPGEERLFLSILNLERRPLTCVLSLPLSVPGGPALRPLPDLQVVVPPSGARLQEVSLPEAAVPAGVPFTLRAQFDGFYNLQLICATPGLDSVSIDHVSG